MCLRAGSRYEKCRETIVYHPCKTPNTSKEMREMTSRKSWMQPIAGILLILPGAICAAGQNVDAGGVRSIEAALRQKLFAQALELAQAQLKKTPHQARILTLEGIAFSALGNDREGLAAFRAVLAMEPNSLAALEGAAQLEFNAGDRGAEALLRRIVRLRPEEPTSHAMLAAIAYRRNDCGQAVEEFRKAGPAIEREPTALTEFGACLLDQERSVEAVATLRQALEVRPEDSHLRYNLGVAQIAAQQYKEAIETFRPLLEESRPDPDVLDEAARAYEETGDTPEAVRLLRMALVANPKELKYYMDFTALALKHSSWDVGLDIVNIGLQQLPDAALLYVARGILNVQLLQFDHAQADFEIADRLDPKQTSGAIGAGMAQMQQHNPQQAQATVEAQLKTHPQDSFLLFIKASALLQNGPAPGSQQFTEAMDAALKSIAAKPSFILARDLLAGMYLESGDYAKAEEQCRLALHQNPSDEKAIFHLIQALRKPGRDPHNELPDWAKRMAELLAESRKTEGVENKYQLYEPEPARAAGAPQPR
jgi:tetratricopeptide (TPR) repeat protein